MKELRIIMVMMLATGLLQACGHAAKSTNVMAADTDTTTANADTTSTVNPTVDKDDAAFASEAAGGSLAEVAMGNLAIKNGKNKKVKNFGAMMVKDHSKANVKLDTLAKAKNLSLPAAPGADEQKMINALAKKWGSDFDKAYIEAMITDHQKDVKLFDDESKKLQDPDLKKFAIKTLPILQEHLDAINAIHDSMGK